MKNSFLLIFCLSAFFACRKVDKVSSYNNDSTIDRQVKSIVTNGIGYTDSANYSYDLQRRLVAFSNIHTDSLAGNTLAKQTNRYQFSYLGTEQTPYAFVYINDTLVQRHKVWYNGLLPILDSCTNETPTGIMLSTQYTDIIYDSGYIAATTTVPAIRDRLTYTTYATTSPNSNAYGLASTVELKYRARRGLGYVYGLLDSSSNTIYNISNPNQSITYTRVASFMSFDNPLYFPYIANVLAYDGYPFFNRFLPVSEIHRVSSVSAARNKFFVYTFDGYARPTQIVTLDNDTKLVLAVSTWRY
jgi:hypothetical protein